MKTCRDCEHLDEMEWPNDMRLFGCKKTGFTIPHAASSEDQQATFFRIPLECPRPDSEVEKKGDKQPHKHWQTLTWAETKA
ncbi:MAG: hypothetical protein MK186_13845 [Henriciella sp.]|nr:hypothetical protein [Henriciella sp.]